MNFQSFIKKAGNLADKIGTSINSGISNLNQEFQSTAMANRVGLGDSDTPQFIRFKERNLSVIKKLAEGGFGFVYQVSDPQNGQHFALKKMVVQSSEQQKLIKNEIEVWRRLSLSGNPNIVGFTDTHFDRDSNSVLILNELCSGGTLFDILTKYHGKMNEPQIVYSC
jgi:serine/threonine protein kinase